MTPPLDPVFLPFEGVKAKHLHWHAYIYAMTPPLDPVFALLQENRRQSEGEKSTRMA